MGIRWAADVPGITARELAAILVFGALVVLFAAFAGSLRRHLVTAPLAFVAAGVALGLLTGSDGATSLVGMRLVAEVTLALVLFHDAAQVRPRQIQGDRGVLARLLLVGLPGSILLGTMAAGLMFPGLSVITALLLAAALAPTDAALGAATVLNPRVPVRVRRMLNVESGLNDGLTTPIVLFAIATIAGEEGLGPVRTIGDAVADLAVGGAAGAAVGAGGAALLTWSRGRRTSTTPSRALAVMFLPLLAFGAADLLSGNGYVAAFVCGTAFAGGAQWLEHEESALWLTEALADPLAYAVWLVFGFAAASLAWNRIGPREIIFAALSLTVLRMIPVGVSLLGTGLRLRTLAFVGWFGPRGLVTVVFAVLALESLALDEDLRVVLTTMTLTVLLSVVAHGISAPPMARAYGLWIARQPPGPEMAGATEPRSRGARLATHQPRSDT
jgi:NhaP-type Na+/H+ or K+/H+ antiporter